jgi:exodeoxyribonuclease-3
MTSIVTWNVNSIRSRITHVTEFLNSVKPDILCLQELKVETAAFPYLEFEDLGYHLAVHGQKTYNGVAIFSRYPLDDIITTLPGDDSDNQARYIEAVASTPSGALRVASVYVPNGQSPDSEKFSYKMTFFDRLHAHIKQLLRYEEALVVAGDYNVAPQPKDVYDPVKLDGTVCFHPDEREKFYRLLNLGLTDAFNTLHPDIKEFSWWDYRGDGFRYDKGLRIDHLLLSPEAADHLTRCTILRDERNKDKPSDHAPVIAELSL